MNLNHWQELLRYEEKEGYSEAIKRAKAKVEQWYVQRLALGKCIPAGLIFILKNNFGWRDVQEFEHSGPGGEPLEMSSLEIAVRVATILELARKRKEELGNQQKQIPEKVESENKRNQ